MNQLFLLVVEGLAAIFLFFVLLYVSSRLVALAWFKSKKQVEEWDGTERRKSLARSCKDAT